MPPQPEAPKPTVLLLDDDRFLLDVYTMKFVHSGYDVHAFLSATEALLALRSGLNAGAIVTDLEMPEIDGFAFLETALLERLVPAAPRIVLTNKLGSNLEVRAHELGACQFIIKATVLPDELVKAVEDAVRKKNSASLLDLRNPAPTP